MHWVAEGVLQHRVVTWNHNRVLRSKAIAPGYERPLALGCVSRLGFEPRTSCLKASCSPSQALKN